MPDVDYEEEDINEIYEDYSANNDWDYMLKKD